MLKKALCLALSLSFLAGSGLAARKTIKLPDPKPWSKMSLEESILRRRSERSFLPQ